MATQSLPTAHIKNSGVILDSFSLILFLPYLYLIHKQILSALPPKSTGIWPWFPCLSSSSLVWITATALQKVSLLLHVPTSQPAHIGQLMLLYSNSSTASLLIWSESHVPKMAERPHMIWPLLFLSALTILTPQLLFSFLTPIQLYWPPCFSLNTPGILPTQGLCTCGSFYLGCSPKTQTYKAYFLQVSGLMLLSQKWGPFWSPSPSGTFIPFPVLFFFIAIITILLSLII